MTDHITDRIGETCPDCGTHHRVVPSLGEHQLTTGAVRGLEESERVHFARELLVFGGSAGEVTEDLVLSTDRSTLALSLYDGHGWVVTQEIEHAADEDPEEVGRGLWAELSQELGEAFRELW